MKKILSSILILFSGLNLLACGGDGYDEDTFYFYNLINQELIEDTDLHPFLREDNHRFYGEDWWSEEDEISNWGNITLWQELLPYWSADDINTAMTIESESAFDALWRHTKSESGKASKQYLEFARNVSDAFEYRTAYSWSYSDHLKAEIPDVSELIEFGNVLYDNEKNEQLKLRYDYQLIRCFHYTRQYQAAINFFESQVKDRYEKNEIYYYILDQVAGCYYSLENYEYAAHLFQQVFENSRDRKKSAFGSYVWCLNKGANGQEYISSNKEQISHLILNDLTSFEEKGNTIQKIIDIDPNDERVELMFMRKVNDIERSVWDSSIGRPEFYASVKDGLSLPNFSCIDQNELKELRKIADDQIQNQKINNKEFWLLVSSYLSFLNKDFEPAFEKLFKISANQYKQQKANLQHVYEVFSWENIPLQKENYLTSIWNMESKIDEDSYGFGPSWKDLIFDYVAHHFFKRGDFAKAFLIHNSLQDLNQLSSIELLDDLLIFFEKSDKTFLEQELYTKAKSNIQGLAPLDYVNYLKGLYFMQAADHQKAQIFLKKVPEEINKTEIGKMVSARVFSNNIMECFSCKESEVMVDSVFLSNFSSFIKPEFTKTELTEYLIRLETLANDETKWKRKIAHYLLGNYYFNISNTGYYRGTLTGNCNGYSARYFHRYDKEKTSAKYQIQNIMPYNLYGISYDYDLFNNMAGYAYEHYAAVLANSSDKELNARCLYMMAKCELNDLYNNNSDKISNWYYGYDGSIKDDLINYKQSFKELKDNYSETQFHKMIIEECSFYKYYCSF